MRTSVLKPAIAVAGAGLLNAAASVRNQAFMVMVLTKERRKNVLSQKSARRTRLTDENAHKNCPAVAERPTRK